MSKPPLSLASHFLPFIAAAIGRKNWGDAGCGLHKGLLLRYTAYYFQWENAGERREVGSRHFLKALGQWRCRATASLARQILSQRNGQLGASFIILIYEPPAGGLIFFVFPACQQRQDICSLEPRPCSDWQQSQLNSDEALMDARSRKWARGAKGAEYLMVI